MVPLAGRTGVVVRAAVPEPVAAAPEVTPPRGRLAVRRAGTWPAAVPVAVVCIPVVSYVWVALHRLGYPYELEWMEGGSVELARRVAAGQPLYTSPTLHFTPWPYPPLYYWLSAAVGSVTGQGFLPLRLVSLVASLAALVLLALLVRSLGGSWTGGVVAAGMYAATYRLAGSWADLARVDSLLVALTLGALLFTVRARRPVAGLAAGLVFVLAVLTKQTALIVAVPAVGWLLVTRRRVGVCAVLTLIAGLLGTTFLLERASDGWYLQYVWAELLGQGVVRSWIAGFWLADLALPFAVLAVAALGASWGSRRRQPGAGRPRSEVAGLAAVVVASLLAAGWAGRLHSGGYSDVVMPAYAAVAVLAGLGFARFLGAPASGASKGGRSLTAAGVLISQLVLLTVVAGSVVRSVPTPADGAAGARLVADIATVPGRVIVADHPLYLTQAGKDTSADLEAIRDVLRGGSVRARVALSAALPSGLSGVDVLILDDAAEAALFQPVLGADFRLSTRPAVPGTGLHPVSDLDLRPTLVFVRRGANGGPW